MKNEIVVSGQVRSFLAQGLSKKSGKTTSNFLCNVVAALNVAAVDDVDIAAIDVAAVDVAYFDARPRTSHKKLLRYWS